MASPGLVRQDDFQLKIRLCSESSFLVTLVLELRMRDKSIQQGVLIFFKEGAFIQIEIPKNLRDEIGADCVIKVEIISDMASLG